MTDERNELLSVFEVRVCELLKLCDSQREKIGELEHFLELKDKELHQTIRLKEELKAKYDSLLTAQIVSSNEGEIKSAKKRLSDLVREVNKCIDLLKSE